MVNKIYKKTKRMILLLIVVILLSDFTIRNYIYAADNTVSVEFNEDDYAIDGIDEGNRSNASSNAQSGGEDAMGSTIAGVNKLGNLLDQETSLSDDEDSGGSLFAPITNFLLAVGDSVEGTLQSVFLEDQQILSNLKSSSSIKLNCPEDFSDFNVYLIKYSPLAIFSNVVPAFDVNFFNPQGNNGRVDIKKTTFNWEEIGRMSFDKCVASYGAPSECHIYTETMTLTELILYVTSVVCFINAVEAVGNLDIGAGFAFNLTVGSLISMALFATAGTATLATAVNKTSARSTFYWRFWMDESSGKMYFWCAKNYNIVNFFVSNIDGTLYEVKENYVTYTNNSTAFTLRSVVSKWYSALRTLALVILLSILLYIGIRIVLSSTSAEQKAKYKNMLVDWFIALCMVFVLHYLMAFIMGITQKIIDIFDTGSISTGGVDYLMTTIRNSIVTENGSYYRHWGYAVMYLALVILTISFTIQYIKRLVFIALLTMIAPLIAITYPLDKIKDGHAQGFSLWLREYSFNCLIQPVHLALYIMIVEVAVTTMKNPIIAIVALASFKPAETFIRKLFGFDKASTMNNLGSIAAGAMTMNMLSRIPKGHGSHQKNNSTDQKTKNNIRMNNNPSSGLSSDGGTSTSGNSSSKTIGTKVISRVGGTSSSDAVKGMTAGSSKRKSTARQLIEQNGNRKPIAKRNVGEISTGHRYKIKNNASSDGTKKTSSNNANTNDNKKLNNRMAKRLAIAGGKSIISGGIWTTRKATKLASKAGGAIAGATLGVAAGMADGELGFPTKNVLAGTMSGSQLGGALEGKGEDLADKTKHSINNVGNKIEDMANEEKAKEEFFQSDGWEKIKNDTSLKGDVKKRTEKILDKGIFDADAIHKELKDQDSKK